MMADSESGRMVTVSCDKKYVTFQWPKIKGIKHYTLIVKNVCNRKNEIIHKNFRATKCSYREELKDDLRIGQTCETRLKMFGPNDNVITEVCTLGGDQVPRNPQVKNNLEKPTRSILVEWTEPVEKPSHYIVDCIPSTGKRKTQKCFRESTKFNRLKTNTVYRVQVMAIYTANDAVETRSLGSVSNMICTHAKPSATLSTQYSNIQSSSIVLQNPMHHSQITNVKSDDFDKPRNLFMKMTTDESGVEMGAISWESPTFSGESDDYEILQYDLEVYQEKQSIFKNFFIDQTQTEKFPINLGRSYTVKIKTKYEEIDAEKSLESDFKTDFHSRPSEPNVRVGVDADEVRVRWDSSRGAVGYELQVTASESKIEVDYQEMGKSPTEHKMQYGEFSLGRYYTFSVTALGKDNTRTKKSVEYLFGGNLIPRMAKATLSKEKPMECVDLSWEVPENGEPLHYHVKVSGNSDNYEAKVVYDTSCTMEGLRSGSKYQFIISAVYADFESDGCLTNEVVIDPRPSHVENLELKLDENHPDNAITCKWDETPNTTIYKITAKCDGFQQENETKNAHFNFEHLMPGTDYSISVAAGNESGFGRESSDVITTELWVPPDISLHDDETGSLIVEFSKGRNTQTVYIVSIYKSSNDVFIEKQQIKENFCTFNNIESNTEYYAKIQTVVGGETSRIIESKRFLTRPGASVIKNVTLCSENMSMDIEIEWENETGIAYNEVEIQTNQEVENILKVANSNQCKYRCLLEGNEYCVRVRAVNNSGVGKWSEKHHVLLAPPKIGDLMTEIAEDKIVLKWEELQCKVDHYLVKVVINDEATLEEKLKETTYTLVDPSPCTKYEFVVQAYNTDDMPGKYSTKDVLTGFLKPPKYVVAQLDDVTPWQTFHLKWDWPKNAKHFLVYASGILIGNHIEENVLKYGSAKPLKLYEIEIHSCCGQAKSEYPATTSVEMVELPAINPDSIKIELDDEMPWQKAKISWVMPQGIDHATVEIFHPNRVRAAIIMEAHNENFVMFNNQGFNEAYYIVEVIAISGQDSSEAARGSFTMGPVIPNIFCNQEKENLVFTSHCDTNSPFLFDQLHFFGESENSTTSTVYDNEYENINTSATMSHAFKGLIPGREYKIYAVAKRGKYQSHKKYLDTHIMIPAEIENVTVKGRTRTTLTVQWQGLETHPDEYIVQLSSSSPHSVTATCPGDKDELEVSILEIDVVNEITVTAKVGNIYGRPGSCRTQHVAGWDADEINKELLRKTQSSEKEKKIITPMISKNLDQNCMRLPDFIESAMKGVNIIFGAHYSGKTTICEEICRILCEKVPVFFIRGDDREFLTSELGKFVKFSFDIMHGMSLSSNEITRYTEWMLENDDKIVFVIDDPNMNTIAGLSCSISSRTMFSRSTVFVTTSNPNFQNQFSGSIRVNIASQSISQIESYLVTDRLRLWQQIPKHLLDSSVEQRHCSSIMNLLLPENFDNLGSIAWVLAKVYHNIYSAQRVGDFIREIRDCPQEGFLMDFCENIDLKNLNLHERFVFALHTIFFSKRSDPLVRLLKYCHDTNFLMLCASCIDPQNVLELFKLFDSEHRNLANYVMGKNINALQSLSTYFVPPVLGKDFFTKFIKALKRPKLTERFLQ